MKHGRVTPIRPRRLCRNPARLARPLTHGGWWENGFFPGREGILPKASLPSASLDKPVACEAGTGQE